MVGLFDDDPASWHKHIHGVEVVGLPEQALSAEWRRRFDEAVLALEDQNGQTREIAKAFQSAGLRIRRLVTGLVEIETDAVDQNVEVSRESVPERPAHQSKLAAALKT